MLAHRIKGPEMPVGSAQHAQAVGNIFNIDQLNIRLQRIKHLL
jgi:hypothetical protein